MAAFPLEAGEVFADRYRIIRVVASGGMGAVYEAVHIVTERRCALKVMLGHTVQREKLRERFMLESKLAAQIGSEYIVDILDAGVDEKTKSPFLVMELLEGEDLAQRLVRLGRFSAAETVTYLWHAALALDRTHRSSIVHRDLKASNLFLTQREDGTPLVKVLDFGVAKVMPLETGNEGHTQTVGTPIYMAPEQFRAGGRVSPATDIYALGMLAYTMLVGTHYWAEEHQNCDNPFAFASIAVKGPKEAATVRAEREGVQLPIEFDEWFSRATSRVPGERFASATEAVEELAAVLSVNLPSAVSSGTNAVPTPTSSPPWGPPEGGLLQETVESRSALLSQGGVPGSSGGSLPIVVTVGTEPSVDLGNAPPERTEISLSVTSGGLDVEEHARQRRRSQIRKALAALSVATLLIVAIVVGRGLDDLDATPPAQEMAASKKPKVDEPEPRTEAAHEEPPNEAPTPEDTAEPPSATEKIPIRSVDELPRATPPERSPPPRRRTKATVSRRESKVSRPTVAQPQTTASTTPQPAAQPKSPEPPSDPMQARNKLLGR